MEIPLTENEFSLLVGLSLCHDPIHDFHLQEKIIKSEESMSKILAIDFLLNKKYETYLPSFQGGKLIPSQNPSLLKSEEKFIKKDKSRDKLDEKINESAYPLLFYLGLLTNDDINSIKSTVKDTNDLQYVKDKIISKIIEKAKIINQEKAKGGKKKKTFKKKNLKKQKTKKKPKKKLTKRKQKRIKKNKTKKNFKGGGKTEKEKELDRQKKRFNQLDEKFNGKIIDKEQSLKTEGYFDDRFISLTASVFTKYGIDATKKEEVRKFLHERSSDKDFINEIDREESKINTKYKRSLKGTRINYKLYCNEFLPLKKAVEELQTEVDAEKAEAKKAAAAEKAAKASQKEKSKGKEKMKPDAGPSGEAPEEAPAEVPPPPPPAPEAAPEIVAEIKDEYESEDDESEEETEEEKELRLQIEQARIEADKDKEAEIQKEQAEQTLKEKRVETLKRHSKATGEFTYETILETTRDTSHIENYSKSELIKFIVNNSTRQKIIEIVSNNEQLSKLENGNKKPPKTIIEILEEYDEPNIDENNKIFKQIITNVAKALKLAKLIIRDKIELGYVNLPFLSDEEQKLSKPEIEKYERMLAHKIPSRMKDVANNKILQLFKEIFDIIDISKEEDTALYKLLKHEKNIFSNVMGEKLTYRCDLVDRIIEVDGKAKLDDPSVDEHLKRYFVLSYLPQMGENLETLDRDKLKTLIDFEPEVILRDYNGKRVIINNGALPGANKSNNTGKLLEHTIGSITSAIDSAAPADTGGIKYSFEPYERGNLIVKFKCGDKYFKISLLDKGYINGVYNCELFIEFEFENNGIKLEVSEEKVNVKKTQINRKGILDLVANYRNSLDVIIEYIAKDLVFNHRTPFGWEDLFKNKEFLQNFIQSYNVKGLGDLLMELTALLNNGGYEGEIIYGGEDEARIEKFNKEGNAPRLYIAHDWPSAIRYMLFKTTLEDKYKNILSKGGYFQSAKGKDKPAELSSLLI